ncbi:Glutamate-pyruvate aminotransferase AlaC [compost metagenome]
MLLSGLREIGWEVAAPKGTFFAWLKLPEGRRSREFADWLLEEAHVAVAPGEGFGTLGDAYVRVGLVSGEDRIAEAVRRIGRTGIFGDTAIALNEGGLRG